MITLLPALLFLFFTCGISQVLARFDYPFVGTNAFDSNGPQQRSSAPEKSDVSPGNVFRQAVRFVLKPKIATYPPPPKPGVGRINIAIGPGSSKDSKPNGHKNTNTVKGDGSFHNAPSQSHHPLPLTAAHNYPRAGGPVTNNPQMRTFPSNYQQQQQQPQQPQPQQYQQPQQRQPQQYQQPQQRQPQQYQQQQQQQQQQQPQPQQYQQQQQPQPQQYQQQQQQQPRQNLKQQQQPRQNPQQQQNQQPQHYQQQQHQQQQPQQHQQPQQQQQLKYQQQPQPKQQQGGVGAPGITPYTLKLPREHRIEIGPMKDRLLDEDTNPPCFPIFGCPVAADKDSFLFRITREEMNTAERVFHAGKKKNRT